MKVDFSVWTTDALRQLLRLMAAQLDEYESLNRHHLNRGVGLEDSEAFRVSIMLQYFRRCYWAVSNELDLRKSLKELET